MTADFHPFDMAAFLGATATRIVNEVKGVNRVIQITESAIEVSTAERAASALTA
jgi:GMP synthase PP-ATPase subunit